MRCWFQKQYYYLKIKYILPNKVIPSVALHHLDWRYCRKFDVEFEVNYSILIGNISIVVENV